MIVVLVLECSGLAYELALDSGVVFYWGEGGGFEVWVCWLANQSCVLLTFLLCSFLHFVFCVLGYC